MKSKPRRFFIWALGISLVLHALVATEVRPYHAEARDSLEPFRLYIERHPPVHTPPPMPTPVPVHAPRTIAAAAQPYAAHPVLRNAPRPVASEAPPAPRIGPTSGVPGPGPGTGSAQPDPTETPRPACSQPDVEAKAVDTVNAEMPEGAAGATGTAQVLVRLRSSGAVDGVSIYRSTGNAFLDRAALVAARQSTYAPEIRACEAVGGSYLFTVDFTDNGT
jgi:protein TonB